MFFFVYFFCQIYRYGFEFLEHTYLYHVTRQDVKHNFSMYFYMMYLMEGSDWASVLGLVSFMPQLLLTVTFGCLYYRDIAFCCFVQTFAFVTFNKVCTSQVNILWLVLCHVEPMKRMWKMCTKNRFKQSMKTGIFGKCFPTRSFSGFMPICIDSGSKKFSWVWH